MAIKEWLRKMEGLFFLTWRITYDKKVLSYRATLRHLTQLSNPNACICYKDWIWLKNMESKTSKRERTMVKKILGWKIKDGRELIEFMKKRRLQFYAYLLTMYRDRLAKSMVVLLRLRETETKCFRKVIDLTNTELKKKI